MRLPKDIQNDIRAVESRGHVLVSQGCTLFRCTRCNHTGWLDGWVSNVKQCPATASCPQEGAHRGGRHEADGEEEEMSCSSGPGFFCFDYECEDCDKKLSAPPPPVCGYVGIDEDESGKLVFGGPCGKPATHDKACGSNGEPVCAGHICRCSVTLEERARRDEAQRVPSHWMAL